MTNIKHVSDDKYNIITNDLERIRTRPSMYISSLGSSGIFHLCKELVDNNRDECLKKSSPGDTIFVEITDEHIMTRDNGRGIPTDILQNVLETIQAGTNMTREQHDTTSGENGVGTACILALSSYLEAISIRPQEGKKLTLRYHDAVLVDKILEDYNGTDHGLIMTFKPSRVAMGEDKIPVDLLKDWFEGFDYTLPENISMEYIINGKKRKVVHKKISEYFDSFIPSEQRMSSVITLSFGDKLKETVLGKTYDRFFEIDAAIVYSDPSYKGEDIRQSWMNMIHTSQNGHHVNGLIAGFIKCMIEKCIKKKKSLEEDDLKRDILAHLHVIVNAKCDFANIFSGQTKHDVFSKIIGAGVEKAAYIAFNDLSLSKLNELTDVIIANNRVRRESERVRTINSSTKTKTWAKPDSYIPCSSVKSELPKELFTVEGRSAGGGIRGARNAKHQAILMFRGKSLNVWDVSLERALKSEPWLNLVKVLGCGIGPTFDIRKLIFDKIIITTDADIDGYHIRTGLCSFFMRFMPEIIEAGKLYIAEPPLYKLASGKEVYYVATTKEYIEKCIDAIGILDIEFAKLKGVQIDSREFVKETFNYLDELVDCSRKRQVNRYLLEHIASGFVKYGSNVDNFVKHIDEWLRSLVKIYKEIHFDHAKNQLTATIDLIDQVVIIDDDLLDSLYSIIHVQEKYGLLIKYAKKDKTVVSTTLSRFFEYITAFYPEIKDRYKGLGSSPAIVSKEVIMDPKTRRIVRVTMDDVLTMQKMAMLVGDGKENKAQRKEMLMNFRFTMDDIDN